MTVSTEISSNEYTGNGVTTDFDYKFRIFKANQLSVITSDAGGDNVVTLRLGTDYTVTGSNKSAGGKVILTKPLANGHKISIARDIPITQETSFRNQSKFFAETHENAFDYLTMILQSIWGSLGSLYLKRPNILANWFDAKGYRIANLGKPKRDSDAVDLGTLKDEIEGVNSTISKKEKRTLRVDDMDISAFPKASERRNKQIGFDHTGMPTLLDPAETGVLGYAPVESFEKGATLTSRYQVLFWEEKRAYFRWDGKLPKVVPPNSTPNETGGIKSDDNPNGLWVDVGDASVRSDIPKIIGGLSNYQSASINDMLNGVTLSKTKVALAVGQVWSSGGTKWLVDRDNTPISLDNFRAFNCINVRDSGARGDGVTDDTDAFNNAAKICRGSLYVPTGTYVVKSILIHNISMHGDGYNATIIKTIATSGAVIKATNNLTANTNNRSIIKGIRVIGTNSHLNSETLIELDVPDEKYVGSIRVTECYLEKASGANIKLKAGTHCIVDNNEIWFAKGCGIELRSTSEFNNVAIIQYNRIKHNWIGIGASNFETMGVVNAPQNRSKAELSGVTIEYNLIEQNTNCNDDGSVWDYTDRLGTINRPGIGILLEGVYGAVMRRNWIEMYYQGIKLNGGNKFNTIEENTMGYTRFDAALQGTGNDMLAPLVLVSHGSGASTENAGNNINENYFVHANGYSGGKYFGDNIILAGQNNQSNTFYRNYKDGGDRTIKITSDTFSDKNILVNYHLDPTDLFVEINAKLSVATLQSKNTILAPDSNVSITTLDGVDAGGAGLFNRLSFKSSKHNINRGNLTIGASSLSATDGSNNMCFLYGNSDPNGIGSLSVYDAGSMYMRKGVGLYVKESPAGTATGWNKK